MAYLPLVPGEKLAAFLVLMRGGSSRNSMNLLLAPTNTVGRHCSARTVVERSVVDSSTRRGPGIRHSTEIAIFCPTFEVPKTVCECFKSRRLKT